MGLRILTFFTSHTNLKINKNITPLFDAVKKLNLLTQTKRCLIYGHYRKGFCFSALTFSMGARLMNLFTSTAQFEEVGMATSKCDEFSAKFTAPLDRKKMKL